MKNSMKKTITMLLVLVLSVALCSFAALADGENEPDLAVAPDLMATAPAPEIEGGEDDAAVVNEEPLALAPAPEGDDDLVPNDGELDVMTAPAPDAVDVTAAAPEADLATAPAADKGGCNATVWIIVACVAVVAIVVIVVLSKKKKK